MRPCNASNVSLILVSVLSILLIKIIYGMPFSSKSSSKRVTANTFAAPGSQTTMAESAIDKFTCVSRINSTDPGVSRKVHSSPRYSVVATFTSTLILRALASGELSPTVLPSVTFPFRPVAPQRFKILSSRVVLPLR